MCYSSDVFKWNFKKYMKWKRKSWGPYQFGVHTESSHFRAFRYESTFACCRQGKWSLRKYIVRKDGPCFLVYRAWYILVNICWLGEVQKTKVLVPSYTFVGLPKGLIVPWWSTSPFQVVNIIQLLNLGCRDLRGHLIQPFSMTLPWPFDFVSEQEWNCQSCSSLLSTSSCQLWKYLWGV